MDGTSRKVGAGLQAACVDEAARADVARGIIPDDVPTVGVAVGAVGERVQCRMPKLPKSRRKQRRGVNGTARGEYTDGKSIRQQGWSIPRQRLRE